MSKYQIQINKIDLSGNTHTASGTIMKDGTEVQFEAETIWWSGTRRWKVKEEKGLAVRVSDSEFTQGERMGIAKWLGEVSKNPELIGKSSGQGTGAAPRQAAPNTQVQELQNQNAQLQAQMAELQAMMAEMMKSKKK